MSEIANLPNYGVAGALVAVIGYLLLANRNDRKQSTEQLGAVIKQYDSRLETQRKQYDRDVTELRDRMAELERKVDHERLLRRQAEDSASVGQSGPSGAASVRRARPEQYWPDDAGPPTQPWSQLPERPDRGEPPTGRLGNARLGLAIGLAHDDQPADGAAGPERSAGQAPGRHAASPPPGEQEP